MAKRFVYVPLPRAPYVKAVEVTFRWEPGMAMSQRQKSSANFHEVLRKINPNARVLECSRAGLVELGVSLSAFNLPYFEGEGMTVENVYQGSKVFKPKSTGEEIWLNNLYRVDSMQAKSEPLLTDKNYKLVEFRLLDEQNIFEPNPRYAFYNYIYIKSLMAFVTREMVEELAGYQAFTDTMLKWHDGKVTSCQAHATAQFVGMLKCGVLEEYMSDKEKFLSLFREEDGQLSL